MEETSFLTPSSCGFGETLRPLNRFNGTILIEREENRPLADHFTEYEAWEIFNWDKEYPRETFTLVGADGLQREFRYYLLILHGKKGEEHYVVTKQVNDLRRLEPYCCCATCLASYLNPLKYILCPYCTRCLKSGRNFTRPEYIVKAEQIRDQRKEFSLWTRCWREISFISGTLAALIFLRCLIHYL